MKIIHCADLHLDSKLVSIGNRQKSMQRRSELLGTFLRLVDFATENNVSHVMICGDLFDSQNVSAQAKQSVLSIFSRHKNLTFFVLGGNHDNKSFDDTFLSALPNNVKLFGANGGVFDLGEVVVFGQEVDKNFDARSLPSFDKKRFNIVMLHGIMSDFDASSDCATVNCKVIAEKNVDYLAMGHYHCFQTKKLNNGGVACYSGCLEGRGFDEVGEKGFVLLDVNQKDIQLQFVPFGCRKNVEVAVEVGSVCSFVDLLAKVNECVEHVSKQDLLKVVLSGKVAQSVQLNVKAVEEFLQKDFFFAKVDDQTRLLIDMKGWENEISLKSMFVKEVFSQSLDEKTREAVLALGLNALFGEEVDRQ